MKSRVAIVPKQQMNILIDLLAQSVSALSGGGEQRMKNFNIGRFFLAVGYCLTSYVLAMEPPPSRSKPLNFVKHRAWEVVSFNQRNQLELACFTGNYDLVREILEGDFIKEFECEFVSSEVCRFQSIPKKDSSQRSCKDALNRSEVCGLPPLCWAIVSGNEKLVGFLLEKGADPNFCDTSSVYGPQIFRFACWYGTYEMIKMLIKKGANLRIAFQGQTHAYWALLANRYDVAELCGVDFEKRLCDKYSAQSFLKGEHSVLNKNEFGIILELHPKYINKKWRCKLTALHYAAQRGDEVAMQVLEQHAADVDARDCQGLTAYDMLNQWKNIYKQLENTQQHRATVRYKLEYEQLPCKCTDSWWGRMNIEKARKADEEA